MFSVDPLGSWNGLPLLLSQTTLDESDKRSDNLAQMNRIDKRNRKVEHVLY